MRSSVLPLYLLGIALLYSSCREESIDPDPNPNPNPNPGPVVEPPKDTMWVTSISDGWDIKTVEYNSDKTIRMYGEALRGANPPAYFLYYPEYENGILKKMYFADHPSGPQSPNDSIVYDQEGRIDKIFSIYKNPSFPPNLPERPLSFQSMAYNARGQLIASYVYDGERDTTFLVKEYTWEGNNLVKVKDITFFLGQPYSSYYTFKYSDKVNPFKHLRYFALDIPYYQYYHSENLVIEEKYEGAGGDVQTTTFEYQFNDKGYPVNRKSTDVSAMSNIKITMDTITYLEN